MYQLASKYATIVTYMEENPSDTPILPSASAQSAPRPLPKRHSRLADLFSTLFVIVAALALALCLIAFVFQSYQVDGPSMKNTLQNNDRLIVWKAGRTWARLTGHQYTPNRGDIIIFNESGLAQYGQDNIKQLVKRVVGLPGERVVVQNGTITIYNDRHPNGFNPDKTLPYGKVHPLPYTSGNIDITLGASQIFVCGDNRADSLDSRAFGPVNLSDVVGKLVMRIYPIDTAERF
jgi:signal peptidase I